jgi:hypothetical protein
MMKHSYPARPRESGDPGQKISGAVIVARDARFRGGERGEFGQIVKPTPLIPAKAGIQGPTYRPTSFWIPAFAGMTGV